MKTLSILIALSIFSASLLLAGCKGASANESAQAAPAPKPMTPRSNAAAAQRYGHEADTPDAAKP